MHPQLSGQIGPQAIGLVDKIILTPGIQVSGFIHQILVEFIAGNAGQALLSHGSVGIDDFPRAWTSDAAVTAPPGAPSFSRQHLIVCGGNVRDLDDCKIGAVCQDQEMAGKAEWGMAMSKQYSAWLGEMFADVEGASVRSMFGGAGMFRQGLMFALSTEENRLAFKADEQTIPDFVAEGQSQWTYPHKGGKQMSMGYWHIPERLLDDPQAFRDWADKAFAAALRADSKKPASKRKHKA